MDAVNEPTSLFGAATVNSAGAASAAQAAETAEDDFQNFLELLTAQLRNQDPLSPLESSEFVAQLASFSTVEQLVNANTRLEDISAAIVGDGVDRFASLIGREVEVAGASSNFDGEELSFRIPSDPQATRVEAVVTDAAGDEIARFDADNINARQVWRPDAASAPPEGDYTVTAVYYEGEEAIAERSASAIGVVEEIGVENGATVLRLRGGTEVSPSDVIALRAVEETPAPDPAL